MIKVLVTGAGAVLGQGIVRALRISDLDLEIAAADPNPLSPALFWVFRTRRRKKRAFAKEAKPRRSLGAPRK